MKIKSDLEQINERLIKVDNHLNALKSRKKFIDKLVYKKLFGVFSFLISKSTSTLLFEQEELQNTIIYLEDYKDTLLKYQVDINNKAVKR